MRENPIAKLNCALEQDGKTVARFVQAQIPPASIALVPYRDGGGNTVSQIPGQMGGSAVVLERGICLDDGFWLWCESCCVGTIAPWDLTLTLYQADGVTEAARYGLTKAWVSSVTAPPLRAASEERLLEKVTLMYDTLKRVSA